MTRSLLERAAKAAGHEVTGPAYRVVCQGVSYHALIIMNERGGESVWDPIDDDGDALRLAVKLRMNLVMETPHAVKAGWAVDQPDAPTRDGLGPWYWKEWIRDHPSVEAATRSAIVNAAAALAKD
jgi:hypothetical protein